MNSCASDEQKSSEKYIKETVEINWDDGIPLDDLFNVSNICRAHSDYKGCAVVDGQVADISISLQSCLIDRRSSLCKTIIIVFSKHPISKLLPTAEPAVLPSNPFYWSMPTLGLEALAYRFNYRSEAMTWWWAKWKLVVFLIVVFSLLTLGLYAYWVYCKKTQLEITLENSAKIAQQIEEEQELARQNQQAKRAKDLRREVEKEAELARLKHLEEENKIAVDAKLANEKAEKLAKEKAEAEAILQAVFKNKN